MNPFAFAFLAWVLLGLELGLQGVLRFGSAPIEPSFVFVLVVAAALNAPSAAAQWGALALGFFVDLVLHPVALTDGGTTVIVGPHALGYLVATQFLLALRRVVNRKNPLTYGLLACLGSAIAAAVVVALLTFHRLYGDPIEWHASRQLMDRLASAVYTGVLSVALSLALIPLGGFLGFTTTKERRFGARTA